jgi:hypothetical protein
MTCIFFSKHASKKSRTRCVTNDGIKYICKTQHVKKKCFFFFNFPSKLALTRRLWTHHSPVCTVKILIAQKVRLDLNRWSVIRGAFTIDSSTATLSQHPIFKTRFFLCAFLWKFSKKFNTPQVGAKTFCQFWNLVKWKAPGVADCFLIFIASEERLENFYCNHQSPHRN